MGNSVDIEEIGEAAKDITELSGRRETNLMDMLNTLKDYDINKHMIIQHTKTNKINFKFFHQGTFCGSELYEFVYIYIYI